MDKAVTIGTFDGLHRGHRLVLDTLKREAALRGLEPAAISFDRHPLEIVAPERAPGDLISTTRKRELIRTEGVEPMIIPFTAELRGMRAADWIAYIRRQYGVRLLVLGYDNTFGSDGKDLDFTDYKALGESLGIEVIAAPEKEGVSSSEIRKAVRSGDIALATALAGHRPELEGRVTRGFHVGSEIGFPTANLEVSPTAVVPKPGVYAAMAIVEDSGAVYPAMVNIGRRPTFKGTAQESTHLTVEAHLIGMDDEIYGRPVRLEWVSRLRDEKKFDSVEELIGQLEGDREKTLSIIKDHQAIK